MRFVLADWVDGAKNVEVGTGTGDGDSGSGLEMGVVSYES